jgi:hypothetical protein
MNFLTVQTPVAEYKQEGRPFQAEQSRVISIQLIDKERFYSVINEAITPCGPGAA